MKNLISLATVLFAATALLLTGCVSFGRKIDQAKVDQLQRGRTTRAEVLQLLGSPDNLSNTNGKETFVYQYIRSTPKGETFIPIYGAFAGGANVQSQSVSVTFDANGVVETLVTSQGASTAGMGASAGNPTAIPAVENDKRPK